MKDWKRGSINEEEDRKMADLWMVPYADLMTTLVILFLGFYGYAQINAKNASKQIRKVEIQEKQSQEAASMIQALEQQNQARVTETPRRIQITFAAPVLFDFGGVELKEGAGAVLDPLVEAFRSIPNPIVVEGHTDDRPVWNPGPRSAHKKVPYSSNFELSTLRASAVIQYFVSKGLEPMRFSAMGFGEHHPVADNSTEEGRSKNRRIEIYVARQ